jgi:transposase-like protein
VWITTICTSTQEVLVVHRNAPLSETGRLRLARCVVEDGWPLRRAAERFQVSHSTADRWARRYRQEGQAGMADRSSRPHASPARTPARTERRIVKLRISERLGPARIAFRLGLAPSTVHAVLTRYGCPRLAHLDRATGTTVRRYERERPGELVHVDVKKLGNIPDGGGWRVTGPARGLKNRRATTTARKGSHPVLGYGAFGDQYARGILAAAAETLQLWDGELSYPDLAEDIAAEARLALAITTQVRELDTKLAALLHQLDPAGILTSVPGVGIINAAQILARLGDPARFRSLAGARSFTGLVPSLTASGASGRHGPPTKSGDAPLREALFMAADAARRADPSLAARYHRLMMHQGKHHNSALCHIATALLTRIIACWRAGTPYQIRDTDGTPLTTAQGRAITAQRYRIPAEIRAQRRTAHAQGASRRHQESPGAPTPARPPATLRGELLDTA